ncbi:MAG TPA: hypothetical protein VKP58_12530 [Candidatus Acidoferrum sp.]|nr:hypothetical protein [Candidatus Acidoferrum sp.]
MSVAWLNHAGLAVCFNRFERFPFFSPTTLWATSIPNCFDPAACCILPSSRALLLSLLLEKMTSSTSALQKAAHPLRMIRGFLVRYFSVLDEATQQATPWSRTTIVALVALVALWAFKVFTTWATWGNLTIDSGHEMYIPSLLAQGKQLYRDVWFMYGPASPYANAFLFHVFGIHLNVLYWAGALSALGVAILLYLTGMLLSSPLVGWTAGAVVLLEAFQPSHFCFPLPYTFAAVYGCLVGCLFLWIAIKACRSDSYALVLCAGLLAAIALLLKPEFGTACYGTLASLIVLRSIERRSWKNIPRDLAMILPGVALCALAIWWMISIRGFEFITQENVLSWPSSFFMKTYGQRWLETHGFSLTLPAFREAIWRTVPIACIAVCAYCLLWWRRIDTRSVLLRVMILLGVVLYFRKSVIFVSPLPIPLEEYLQPIFFPSDMVLYVVLATILAWGYFVLRQGKGLRPSVILLLTFSSLLAFRILMATGIVGYSIYYNGPVVLSFLILAHLIIPRSNRLGRYSVLGNLLLCAGCLAVVALTAGKVESRAKDFVALKTERGTIRVSKNIADNYEAGIRLMKEKASEGQSVLSIPEDTSLYFLSNTYCPTRVFSFTPGSLAPGKMINDVIEEIESKNVQYLLWSNRTFPDFGTPVFGEDFDKPLGDYLKSHYRPVGPLLSGKENSRKWQAVIWQRVPDGTAK